eukprot:TRINITY_DN3718_c0_g1_i1.p1 TRINITY_DN3718_c0_g1~~TRINITY_DN3718_c0_g1_i1.p1  ORF type:complete len:169 (+),score=30.44 TRINITY_DN3718_c0_g1_i1:3-509(+)
MIILQSFHRLYDLDILFLFSQGYGNHRNLHTAYRRQRQMCIRDRQQGEQYLRDHHIHELFEDICTKLCLRQPENIDQFVMDELKLKEEQGFMTGTYDVEELGNIFNLFDLKREGFINRKSAIRALQVLSTSDSQYEQVENQQASIPDKLDIAQFVRQAEKFLGIKQQI